MELYYSATLLMPGYHLHLNTVPDLINFVKATKLEWHFDYISFVQ